ncbi:MAG: hypothetical protein IJX19_13110 [Clostridia bacterium]|nr:hypothetical protein [Clostridia bacterium]
MKRKLFAILLVCSLLMTVFASCKTKSDALIEAGEDVISLMVEMLESEEYASMYGLSDRHSETLDKLRQGDYSKFSSVYELSIPEEELLEKLDIDEKDFSKDLYQYLCSSSYGSFASRVNMEANVEAISVSSAFAAQKVFVDKKVDENKIYLFVFEKGCPIVVSFITEEDGAFRVSGQFIINDRFVTDDEDSIQESCKAFGFDNVKVTEQ